MQTQLLREALGGRLNGRSGESRVTRMVTSNDGVNLSSDELCA